MADEFKREERYIVIKRKHLHPITEASLRNTLNELGVGTVECVVVESDWPEYEAVWRMIEERVTGRVKLTPAEHTLLSLVQLVREYLPPDGISKDEFINRVLGVLDNDEMAELVGELEGRK